MEKEYLIKKWLDNDLSPLEEKAFKALDDYQYLIKISNHTKLFVAPEYSYEEALCDFQTKIESKTKQKLAKKNWLNPLLKMAAVLVLAFGIYFYMGTLDTRISSAIAESTRVTLPDNSVVRLNASSQISFNKRQWAKLRKVTLNGEAFFKVAKGKTFDVFTALGKVTVLGTQFNVAQREGYFKVTCYEGLVRVNYNQENLKLHPGETFEVVNKIPKLIKDKSNMASQPSWLEGLSAFKSTPLKYVLLEFERHYKVKISSQNINTEQLFTGKFTHTNMDIALQSILKPLSLKYIKTNNTIRLIDE